jgi:hypothetical protein
MFQATARILTLLLPIPLLLSACGKDPLGPDNRMALMALGECRHNQALLLTDNALARGSEPNQMQALLLKAAILRDRGDDAAAEALYPRIDDTWQAVKRRALTPERREHDIQRLIDVARDERRTRGMDPGCADTPPAPQPPAAAQ